MTLAGKVCVITGAGTGIGKVLATAYAGAGATVVLAARRAQPLEDAAAVVREQGGTAHIFTFDVREEEECRRLIASTIDAVGRVDVLLNNAAVPGTDQPVSAMDLSNWTDTIATNVTGPMLLTREALTQAMMPAAGGNIQFFSSGAAKTVLPNKAHYAVAKLGLLPLAQTLAIEVGPLGIRVNTLVIGTVVGDLVDAWVARIAARDGVAKEALLDRLTASAALRRLVRPEEVAATSLWLASDASSAITGQDINVSAGSEKR